MQLRHELLWAALIKCIRLCVTSEISRLPTKGDITAQKQQTALRLYFCEAFILTGALLRSVMNSRRSRCLEPCTSITFSPSSLPPVMPRYWCDWQCLLTAHGMLSSW